MPANNINDLASQALALPEPDRLRLAQCLWESIESDDLPGATEGELRMELRDRLRDQPDSNWKSHAQLMEEARREFGCGK
jgi:putative addiction module component (TIGR02574 family)